MMKQPPNPIIPPRFHLRWFTPLLEVKLCGHATLAAAHTLFSSGLVNTNIIQFLTLSGVLTATKITNLQNSEEALVVEDNGFYVELDFPADPIIQFNSQDHTSLISGALKGGASIIDIKRTRDNLLVVVNSGKNVTEIEPQLDVVVKCPGNGIIVSGIAPPDSGFDFYSRYFAPKFGVNEDPVCGSAHCALACYWSKKLGKSDLNAYQVLEQEAYWCLVQLVWQLALTPFCMSMAKKPVKYYVVDAFTESAFKGNPAAVCLLEQEMQDSWLQSLATEFNINVTCFLIPIHRTTSNPRFHLRWFTPLLEVKICGHATLAAAHALFSYGLVDSNVIEFVPVSGVLLTAKKIPNLQKTEAPDGSFYIELDFPADHITESNSDDDTLLISKALKSASVIEIKRTRNTNDLLVVVTSEQNVTEIEPQFDVIAKCPGRGIIVTGIASPDSEFDFYSRFFCPKYGVNEDPVCGSAHCALASYWSKKLGKRDLNAYQASGRGGVLKIHIDEEKQRVFLRGNAVTVMEGSVMV